MRLATTRVDRSFARCPLLRVPAEAGGKGAEHSGGQGLVHCAPQRKVVVAQALPRGHWLLLLQEVVPRATHRKFPLPSTEPAVKLQDDPQMPIGGLLTWKQPPWTES
jgi:hypothetical protein